MFDEYETLFGLRFDCRELIVFRADCCRFGIGWFRHVILLGEVKSLCIPFATQYAKSLCIFLSEY